MKKMILCLWVSLVTAGFVFAQGDFIVGEIKSIPSGILKEERTLNIYIPNAYKNDTSHYPVIYLLDGSADEDFIHVVGLVQFLVMYEKIPSSIVVGIANVDRKRDFTFPTTIEKDKKDFPTTGGSESFIRFLEEELQPFIQKTYRVNHSSMLIGQSLGGLVATEILLKKPWLFNKYMIVSPSLWWDNESLLKALPGLVKEKEKNYKNIHVVVAVGKEGARMEGDAKKMVKLLTPYTKTGFLYLPGEDHASILHRAVYGAFEILYPGK